MTVDQPNKAEGAAFTVTVSRSGVEGAIQSGSVKLVTGNASDTALPGPNGDYTAVSQTLTWAAMDFAAKTVQIQTSDDTIDEPAELFTIALADSTEGYSGVGSRTVTIDDLDDPPTVTIGDVSAAEGTGTTPTTFSFPVTLSAASGRDISVNYATANGTATAGQDFTNTTGTLAIPKGTTTAKIDVPVTADNAIEPTENFTVVLSLPDPGDPPDPKVVLGTASTGTGTITNDDTLPTLAISGPGPTAEGSGGLTTKFPFVISLSKTSATAVTVAYSTADGSASAPADYLATEQSVTFAPNETTKTVYVDVRADNDIEQNEDFAVTLSDTGGLVATVGGVTAIIVDDDTPKPPAPPPPPVVTRDLTPPAIKLSKITSSRGVMRLTVTCPVGEQTCRGTVTVFSVPARKSKVKSLRREVKLGSSLFVLSGGQQAKLTLRPSKRVARLIRQARSIKARAYAVARDAAGNVGTAQSKGTVRVR